MLPRPTRAGQGVAAAAALLLLGAAGAGSAPLAVAAVATLALLLALEVAMVAVAGAVRAGVRLAWWTQEAHGPGGVQAGRLFSLHVRLDNDGPLPLGRARLAAITSSGLVVAPGIAGWVAGGRRLELRLDAQARSCGRYLLHGAVVDLRDPLGLWRVEAYFPNPLALRVPPASAALGPARADRRLVGALEERGGRAPRRRPGVAGALVELRAYVAGDPFRQIAWKATARTGRLMVQQREREVDRVVELLVDVSGALRAVVAGGCRLERALERAAGAAGAALAEGDAVGLTLFDRAIVRRLPPGRGRGHALRIVELLVDARHVCDPALSDLTEGELVARVARYLAVQEGIDARVRRPPPPSDPSWERLAAGPGGELYDLDRLVAAARRIVADGGPERAAGGRASEAGDGERPAGDPGVLRTGAGALHALCAIRGIELPARRASPDERDAGLAAALDGASASGSAGVLVVAPLSEAPGPAARAALGRARRRRCRVVALPLAPAAHPGLDPTLPAARALEAVEAARSLRTAARWAAAGLVVAPGADFGPVAAPPPIAPVRRVDAPSGLH